MCARNQRLIDAIGSTVGGPAAVRVASYLLEQLERGARGDMQARQPRLQEYRGLRPVQWIVGKGIDPMAQPGQPAAACLACCGLTVHAQIGQGVQPEGGATWHLGLDRFDWIIS